MPRYRALVLDFGDVLFSWSPSGDTKVSPKTVKEILSSDIWYNYERGRFSQDVCYKKAAERFSLDASHIAEAFSKARDSLQPDNSLTSFIRELKDNSGGALSVYAMSNIPKEDYKVLRTKEVDWSIFDDVFISGSVGMRKPDLCFYRYVLKAISASTSPEEVIFIDNKLENILSAQSFGANGIVFENVPELRRKLKNLLSDPVGRGKAFLTSNAKRLSSVTNTGVIIHDNFSQLLLLEATDDWDLISLEPHKGTWNFFIGEPKLTTDYFPNDLDTTSIAMTTLRMEDDMATPVLDKMLQYMNSDGLVLTYFDVARPRIDPVVCINVLRLFYKYGRGNDLSSTMSWVHQVLLHRAYMQGTRYYSTPEAFLYFLCRLCQSANDLVVQRDLTPLLAERVKERIGASGDALCLAMRLLACESVGISNLVDLNTLLSMQSEDGGWPTGWLYRMGSSDIEIGNRGVTTAFAIKAIEAGTKLTPREF